MTCQYATVHGCSTDLVMFDHTTKETHSVDVALPNSHTQPSQYHHPAATEVNRLKRRCYKNVATENGQFSSTSTNWNWYYGKGNCAEF